MSIQILDNNNPDARREVRERINGVLQKLVIVAGGADGTDEDRERARNGAREEIKALYFALTGHGATDDELAEMMG